MPVKKRPKIKKFKNGLKRTDHVIPHGLGPLMRMAADLGAKTVKQINDANDEAIERITGIPMTKKEHRELHKFCADAAFFGRGMIHVSTKNGKRIIKHIPMDRPAPDFDEATCRSLDQVMLNPRRWFGEAKPRRKR